MIVAVDGTLASGKGTLSKRLAKHYGLPHLDTGLLYRGTGFAALSAGVEFTDEDSVALIAAELNLQSYDEADLRTHETGQAASKVAVLPAVRAALLKLQRDFAGQAGGAILDGRDIGTVICPNADVKLWVDATPEVRAMRRFKEHLENGDDTLYEDVLAALIARDTRDSTRADAPMKKAPDAHLIDTSELSIEAAMARAISIIDATAR